MLVLALVALAGCGDKSGSSAQGSVLSAAFGNLAGANTSGVGISTPTVTCTSSAAALSCKAFELPGNLGREVDIAIDGAVVAGMDYRVETSGGNAGHVTFFDPTTFGTASGLRQWNAVDGTGTVHVDTFDGAHVAFSYGASMQAFGSPAAGSFDISGAASVTGVTTAP